jgi:hypothetical protein
VSLQLSWRSVEDMSFFLSRVRITKGESIKNLNLESNIHEIRLEA